LGRRLDDDEYLVDCGCNPRAVNEITTIYLMPGERDIEIPSNSPDDNEEVAIPLTSPKSVTPTTIDNQVPAQSPMRREIHREATQLHQNITPQAGTSLDDEQPTTSYKYQHVPYHHQVDLDDDDEYILHKTPDSLGTPDVRKEENPVSHLVFTPIAKTSTPPSVQLESIHQDTSPVPPREVPETNFVIPNGHARPCQ